MSNELTIPTQVKITNLEEFNSANELLTKWKEELKRIDADEKAITAPINKSLRDLRAKYKPVKDRCNIAITILRDSLNEYKRKEDAKREQDRLAIAELAKDGTATLDDLISLADEAPMLGGRLTTTVTANFTELEEKYVRELINRCEDKVMIEIRKDVFAGRVEKGVTVTKEKKL